MRRYVPLLGMIWLGSVASARPPEPDKAAEARRHYGSGLAHFNLQEYREAALEFEAAYRLRPDPVFLYNLGQSYRLSDNPERALYFYRAYLRNSPDAPNRHEVDGRIQVIEKLMSEKKNLAVPPDSTIDPGEARDKAATGDGTSNVASGSRAGSTAPAREVLWYKRWWVWTIAGVVVAGAVTGLAVGLTVNRSQRFDASLGTVGPAALRVEF